ncbi:glycosyltransferase [uncultured Microbacterium sp.]|uniref:glycosyltransferase n=1 Tax=uncultured Microbacterium sp. TaxID=191216 RepID=UPI0028DC7283|nr:glycosyltransferase [uncultured Microbacterium sp.]
MILRVFVSVGTDHHPFARLIDWIDAWAAEHPDVALTVQHGSSPASVEGENHVMMTSAELDEQYRGADIVVSQVGPGTIADANRADRMPIVVPRDPALGEVVDGHQYPFGEFMAAQGRCVMVTSEAQLREALDRATSAPATLRYEAAVGGSDAAAALGDLVASVVAAPRRRLSWDRMAAMLRRPDA